MPSCIPRTPSEREVLEAVRNDVNKVDRGIDSDVKGNLNIWRFSISFDPNGQPIHCPNA